MSCHVNGCRWSDRNPGDYRPEQGLSLAQLNAYADHSRKNDVYGRMRDNRQELTPESARTCALFRGDDVISLIEPCAI